MRMIALDEDFNIHSWCEGEWSHDHGVEVTRSVSGQQHGTHHISCSATHSARVSLEKVELPTEYTNIVLYQVHQLKTCHQAVRHHQWKRFRSSSKTEH